MDKFDAAFNTFFTNCQLPYEQKYIDDNMVGEKMAFSFTTGRRYVKVIQKTGVFCFVDKTNGDVLYPASWSSPAKHARGNIYDQHNGLQNIGPHGPDNLS